VMVGIDANSSNKCTRRHGRIRKEMKTSERSWVAKHAWHQHWGHAMPLAVPNTLLGRWKSRPES
jgi:hypothetical protein